MSEIKPSHVIGAQTGMKIARQTSSYSSNGDGMIEGFLTGTGVTGLMAYHCISKMVEAAPNMNAWQAFASNYKQCMVSGIAGVIALVVTALIGVALFNQ